MKNAAHLGCGERATGVHIHLQQASAARPLQNDGFRIFPEMEGDMACLNGHNGRHALVVIRTLDVVDMWGIQRFHVNIVNDALQEEFGLLFIVGRGSWASLHFNAQQQMMVLHIFVAATRGSPCGSLFQ